MRTLIRKIFEKKSNKLQIEDRFDNWLNEINNEDKVDDSIIGFNFGILESDNGYIMYLIGSKRFDKEDEDWATEVDFEPKSKYFELGKEFSEGKQWEEILTYSENLVGNYVRSDKFEKSILSKATAITTGFDDGNLSIILNSVD